MVFIALIALIILCITIYSIVEQVLMHRREIEKLKRSDFICKSCRSHTPTVIASELNQDIPVFNPNIKGGPFK
ncbi:hypothetical protein CPT_Mater219 [Bacillus phage Mater]|uniref:Uncharacterized protein n=1 Tax=Bacillus phage Mater TaxID=1540090 RepID=A0A0A0RS91_9CAUD|nr:hypothetical protein CPT_Mater219 [Bacillus phage Mater]AIW03376.1 hypothetical protein CPT_Mater219 [Bacillus phage Mater]